jgi:polyhydroxybutyrate depolymerase
MEKIDQGTEKNSYPPYPEYPYSPPIKGLFHNQAPQDSSVPGRYSVYIPDNFEPCSPAILILTPTNTSAQAFLESGQGQNWLGTSATYGIVIVVAEPYEANVWNLSNSVNLRDDDTFLKNIYDTIRSKEASIPAAFDLNERALYLAGYAEGGNAAHKFTMLWPQIFAGMASVDGGTVLGSIITSYGDRLSYPFAQASGSLDGHGTINLFNKEIPTPVWMIASTNPSANSEAVKNHWITAAGASQGASNDYAQEVYENGAKRVWVTEGESSYSLTPQVIYREFFMKVQRFMSEPGGIVEWTVDHVNQDGKGFFFTETEVGGKIRRWLTYIPSSYNATRAYPLVMAIHGGTSVNIAFTGDSRWQDAAEKYSLIVVFPQAYPAPIMSNIPAPIWNQYVLAPSDPTDDVAFIKEVIARTKESYSVDAERIYATGHSNGAGMSWRLGIDVAECFTAIAPVGLTLSSYGDGALPSNLIKPEAGIPAETPTILNEATPLDVPLPVWVFMGRYDLLGADQFVEGNYNDLCLKYWGVRNGFDPSVMSTEYDETGRYYTRTWTNGKDDIPLFRYASVGDCPHAYTPYECDLLWREFFGKITMDSTGKRYFDGREIVRG